GCEAVSPRAHDDLIAIMRERFLAPGELVASPAAREHVAERATDARMTSASVPRTGREAGPGRVSPSRGRARWAWGAALCFVVGVVAGSRLLPRGASSTGQPDAAGAAAHIESTSMVERATVERATEPVTRERDTGPPAASRAAASPARGFVIVPSRAG